MKSATAKKSPSLRDVVARLDRIEKLVTPTPIASGAVAAAPTRVIDIRGAAVILPLRPRMVRIGADGEELDVAAKANHVAVLLPDYGLLYDARAPQKARNQAEAEELGKKVDLFGFKDWQLWSDEEAQLVIRRDLLNPATDTVFFPNTPTEYAYKTRSTYLPSSSDYAWFVYFGLGGVGYVSQNFTGFVRACRRVPARQ